MNSLSELLAELSDAQRDFFRPYLTHLNDEREVAFRMSVRATGETGGSFDLRLDRQPRILNSQNAAHDINAFAGVRVLGALDWSLLLEALSQIVRRHESLRTASLIIGETMVRALVENGPIPFQRVDLQGVPDPDAQALWLLASQAKCSFDPAGVLWRFALVKLR